MSALCRPEQEWEGANEAMEPSVRGEVSPEDTFELQPNHMIEPNKLDVIIDSKWNQVTGMVNQLRDPAILRDQDGTTFLFYTGAGEQNIGVVNLEIVDIWQDIHYSVIWRCMILFIYFQLFFI